MNDARTTFVEDRLRDTYNAVTTRTEYSSAPILAPFPVHEPSSGRRRRSVFALVGAAVVIALVLGVLSFVQRHDTSTPRPTTPPVDTGPLFPPVQTHVGPELYLAPIDLPVGFELVRGTTNESTVTFGSGADEGASQIWVELDDRGRPMRMFTVGWRPISDRHGWGDVEPAALPGREAFWGTESGSLVWHEDGQDVFVRGHQDSWIGSWPAQLSRTDVEAIASRLVRDPARGFVFSEPPNGFRLAAESPWSRNSGQRARLLAWSDLQGRGVSVQLVDDTQAPPGDVFSFPGARLVEARGRPAVWSTFMNGGDGSGCGPLDSFRCESGPEMPGLPEEARRRCENSNVVPGSARFLQWLEPDGTRVTITTVGMGDDAPFEIARSLREVTQSEFEATAATAPTRVEAMSSPFRCRMPAP